MEIFEEVKEALDIRQVVEFYGHKLNRAGKFVCPFHNDTHPSASIKNDYFNCFVCGAGGDLITFTAKLFDSSNIDACKRLIGDFGLNIDTEPPTPASRLRADRARRKRLEEQRKREQVDKTVRHTGDILAKYHHILYEAYKYANTNNKWHIRALQELTQLEYYIDCYDSEPVDYSMTHREQVQNYERCILEWNNERQ